MLQKYLRIIALFGAFSFCTAATAQLEPPRYELKLVGIYEGAKPEYIFVIGDSGFRTVESLKQFLGGLHEGSELRWAPGCERFGDEPLLSSEKDLAEFREFLKERGIKFTLVPSG